MTREVVTLPKTLPARETSFFAGTFGAKKLFYNEDKSCSECYRIFYCLY